MRSLRELPALKLAAVASTSPATTALLPPGCVLYHDWRAMLDTSALDGVIVATPPAVHAVMVEAAVARGAGVLVEKPLCLSLAEALRLQRSCAGGLVMVEHTHLFAPAYLALRERTRATAVRAIEVTAGARGPFRADVPVLWDWGSHWVAVCLDLLGAAPATCSARLLEERIVEGGRAEHVRLALGFTGGVEAVLDLSNLREVPVRRLSVRLDSERLVYDELAPAPLTRHAGRAPAEVIPVAPERPLRAALRAFAEVLQRGRCTISCLDLGVEVVRVLDACTRSLAKGGAPCALN